MKLELKHLVPYLPYKLQMKCAKDVIWRPNGNEKPLIKEADATLTTDLLADIEDGVYDSLTKFKPILRPLSDLKNVIGIDGILIYPLLELTEKVIAIEPESFNNKKDAIMWIDAVIITEVVQDNGYYKIPHWAFQELIKWKFDVFGLIKKELAIDINILLKIK